MAAAKFCGPQTVDTVDIDTTYYTYMLESICRYGLWQT